MKEEKIQEKIESTRKQLEKVFGIIEKCDKRIEKIKKESETKYGIVIPESENWRPLIEKEVREKFDEDGQWKYWVNIDFTLKSVFDQKKSNLRKVKELESRIEKLQKQIETVEYVKFEYKSLPQVIKDFLENWKTKAVKFHIEHRSENKDFENLTDEQIEKIVEEEKIFKGVDISRRVFRKCGKITDASYLTFGNNGGINGRIIGEKGAADVTTIMAGGYNIQCLHFRVLVK